jgi:short-subunit dehydrogenase
MGERYASHVPTALVTGASSGIGLELAKLLARDGHDLVLVARTGAKLAELGEQLREAHGISTKVMPKDLVDPAAPTGIASRLEADGIAVSVLVSSAGFADHGRFAEADLAKQLDMIQVNVTALTQLTGLLLPGMISRGEGRILNLASTAAFQPGPLMSVYYATKAYVLSFSEALANELEGTGVTVTALCPGPTRTGFQERAALEESKLVPDGLMSPEEVAAAGYAAMLQGKSVEIPGFRHWAGAQLPRFVPRRTAARIVRRVQERAS